MKWARITILSIFTLKQGKFRYLVSILTKFYIVNRKNSYLVKIGKIVIELIHLGGAHFCY